MELYPKYLKNDFPPSFKANFKISYFNIINEHNLKN